MHGGSETYGARRLFAFPACVPLSRWSQRDQSRSLPLGRGALLTRGFLDRESLGMPLSDRPLWGKAGPWCRSSTARHKGVQPGRNWG